MDHPHRHLFALLLTVILLAGCSSKSAVTSGSEKHMSGSVTTPSLAELRQWQLAWLLWENGGIVLIPSFNEDESDATYARLIGRRSTGLNDYAWQTDREALNQRIADVLAEFFAKARHSPGTYTIRNRFREQAFEGRIQLDSNRSGHSIVVPDQDSIDFEFTETHRALIAAMNVRPGHEIVEVMDVKRPYGEMTDYYGDMAAALGESVSLDASGVIRMSSDRMTHYRQLHGEMLFAVQTFFEHAEWPVRN